MLYLTMTFPENGKQDGVLLALSNGQMRIALEGCPDAVELREVAGQWALDDGTPVELDGLLTDGDIDVTLFSELYPWSLAAGQLGEKPLLAGGHAGNGSSHFPVGLTASRTRN